MNGELRQTIPYRQSIPFWLIKYIFIFVNFARSETGRLLRLSTDACHFTQNDSFEVVSHLKDMFKVKAAINLDNRVYVTINMRLQSNSRKKLPVLFYLHLFLGYRHLAIILYGSGFRSCFRVRDRQLLASTIRRYPCPKLPEIHTSKFVKHVYQDS